MEKELEVIQSLQEHVSLSCCSKVSRARHSPCAGGRASRKQRSHFRPMRNGVHHADVTDTHSSWVYVLGLMPSFNQAEPQLVYSCHRPAEGRQSDSSTLHNPAPASQLSYWKALLRCLECFFQMKLLSLIISVHPSEPRTDTHRNGCTREQVVVCAWWCIRNCFWKRTFCKTLFSEKLLKAELNSGCWIFMGLNRSYSGSPQRLSWWVCFL